MKSETNFTMKKHVILLVLFLLIPVLATATSLANQDEMISKHKNNPLRIIANATSIVAISDVHGGLFQVMDTLIAAHILQPNNQPFTPNEAHKILKAKDYSKYFSYIGQKTILIFCGDYVSRGKYSREVIDLVLFLSEEAKKQGGEVIALPGNHEIRLLDGTIEEQAVHDPEADDFRVVVESFQRVGKKNNQSFKEMIAADSLYGKWLRSLPMAAMINGILFIHAGISPEDKLTDLAHFYQKAMLEGDWANKILTSKHSPLWIRKIKTRKQKHFWWYERSDVVNILESAGADYMVVGHDPGALGKKGIIGERFGRIFNIDVGMTPDKGYSSGGAMLIDCKKKQPVFTALEAKTSGVFTKRVLHCEARNMQK